MIKTSFKLINSTPFLHTILASIIPILFFYSINNNELSLKTITVPFVFSLSIGLLMYSGMWLLMRNQIRAGFSATILIFTFFSYGHLSNVLSEILFIQFPNRWLIGTDKVLLPMVVVTVSYILIRLKNYKNSLLDAVCILNKILALFVIIQITQIAISEYKSFQTDLPKEQEIEIPNMKNNNQQDIYYIILDGYARNDVLESIYDYDNSKFTKALEDMGFYIATKSRSNYSNTYLSLASSLNMKYLDFLSVSPGTESKDRTIPQNMIQDSEIVSMFRNSGYTIINLDSAWAPTGKHFLSDVSFRDRDIISLLGWELSVNEFNLVFLQTTILSPFIKQTLADKLRVSTLHTFNTLEKIPYIRGKKFVLAHINLPHHPYIFDAEGFAINKNNLNLAKDVFEDKIGYLSQLIFITRKTQSAITNILRNSTDPPIIILQSDHGPASILGPMTRWEGKLNKDGVDERMSILNAYYFPNGEYNSLYNSISPVNTFRLILHQFFGLDIPLLPDKAFISDTNTNVYDFIDVTEQK